MSQLLLGLGKECAYQLPLWGKGSVVRYWAENGLVHWEDSKDNSYGKLSVRDALLHVKGLNDLLGRSSDDHEYADERLRLQRFIDEMVEIIKKAREQGSPDAIDAGRENARRRPRSVSIPVNVYEGFDL